MTISTSNNGSSGSDTLVATDSGGKISAGAGDDTLVGGSGSDKLNGDAGSDLFIYNVTQNNAGTHDVYTGGSGVDAVLIEFTLAQWLDPATQEQITDYLAHLAMVTNVITGQVSNALVSDFTFCFGNSTLTLQTMERVRVTVDGVELDPANALAVATADTASVSEDGPSVSINVLLNDSVPDLVKDVSLVTGPGHGDLTLVKPSAANPATWYFQYEPHTAHYQDLAVGETATDTFEYQVTDANDDTSTATVTVIIIGANDGPTISAAVDSGGASEDGSTPELGADGTITFDDVDLNDTHSVTVTPKAGNMLGGTLTAQVTTDSTGPGSGMVTWYYDVANAATQYLAVSETATESFTITIDDGSGGTVSQDVTITITGTNDAPTIGAAVASSSVTEDSAPLVMTTNGTVTFDDVDLADSHTTSVAAAGENALGGMLSAAITDPAGGLGDGTVRWDYSVDNSAGQALAADESVIESFEIAIDDGHGGIVTQTVSVTVEGVNDDPTISAAAATGSVTEDASPVTLSTSGTITFDDIDLTDLHTASVAAAAGNTLGGTLAAQITDTATGAGNGTVTWTYSLSNAVTQPLGSEESVNESFTVTLSDGKGGTVSQTITVTINGLDEPGPIGGADNIVTNAGPGVTFAVPEWALLANDTLTGGGTLDVADLSDASGLTAVHSSGTGSAGTVTITDSAPTGGSFQYTPTDGSNAGAATLAAVSQDLSGSLDGTSGSDILVGNSNGSIINGGQGDDIELGGAANDIYVFGLADGKDTIADAGGGNDAIQITTTSPLDSTALGTLNFEQIGADLVVKAGSTEITVKDHFGTGTVKTVTFTNGGMYAGYAIGSTAYRIGADLSGTGQQDVIASSVAGQGLTGGNGNDLLFGNGGADSILGGGGNDLVVGGAGNDSLQGGSGADVFVFNTALDAAGNVDQLLDFNASATDKISLSSAIYSGVGSAGPLAASDFASVSGTGASASVAAGVNIIYDSVNGNLYYDVDGGSAANRTLFATVTVVGGAFDHGDVLVVN
jgi:large repetitive protein